MRWKITNSHVFPQVEDQLLSRKVHILPTAIILIDFSSQIEEWTKEKLGW